MEIHTDLHSDEEFISELRDCAKLLIEKLQSDDYENASKLIHSLVEVRDHHVFTSVGKLTRGLHNAIVNFHVDAALDTEPPTVSGTEIKDASDRLNYVIKMTQNAADKTMDKVEAAAPIAMNLGQEAASLRKQWQRLRRREINAEEFRQLYKRMDDFLVQMGLGTEQLSKNLQDIILEQGYQDLTGQVLKRVIGLIRDVEQNLVSLVRIAGQVEEITGLAEMVDKESDSADVTSVKSHSVKNVGAEGPQIHADKRDDMVAGQDDVDDLLSSLGF